MPTITKTVTLEDLVELDVSEDDFDLLDLVDMIENKIFCTNVIHLQGELKRLKGVIEEALNEKDRGYLEDQMKKEFMEQIFDRYTIWELEKMIPA